MKTCPYPVAMAIATATSLPPTEPDWVVMLQQANARITNLVTERNLSLHCAEEMAAALKMCLRMEGNLPPATVRQIYEALDNYLNSFVSDIAEEIKNLP